MKRHNIYAIIIVAIIILIILFIINQYYLKHKESFKSVSASSSSRSSAKPSTAKPVTSTETTTTTTKTTVTTNNSSTSKKRTCFSKDTLLQLEDGNTIKINDAKLGNKILSYSIRENKLKYSPIIAIPHEENNILSEFVEIKTFSGKNIKMTTFHLIPLLKNNKKSFELSKAIDIEINDIIITVDGNEIVTAKEIISENGIYTVVTNEDYIVVNNIIASPFAISHLLPSFYYQIHKIVYNINPKLLETVGFNKFNKTSIKVFDNIYEMYEKYLIKV